MHQARIAINLIFKWEGEEDQLNYVHAESRITNVQVTVVQPPNIATSDKRAVIVCRALFLVLFWRSKKEQ
jgi:hypothetical protein